MAATGQVSHPGTADSSIQMPAVKNNIRGYLPCSLDWKIYAFLFFGVYIYIYLENYENCANVPYTHVYMYVFMYVCMYVCMYYNII